ncbi:MAG TPA: PAS domain-containing protein [Thermoguttaceae bacterium]|nr:PAS domain-containing protein [Thermoguttaceae bacterium]
MPERDDSGYFKDLLNAVLEACVDAVIMADLDGVIMMFNEDAEAVLRRESLDALGEDLFAMLFPQEDVPAVKAALRDEGHVRGCQSRIVVGKDEEEVFVEVTILKTPDAPGRARALMALIRDVTARKRP